MFIISGTNILTFHFVNAFRQPPHQKINVRLLAGLITKFHFVQLI